MNYRVSSLFVYLNTRGSTGMTIMNNVKTMGRCRGPVGRPPPFPSLQSLPLASLWSPSMSSLRKDLTLLASTVPHSVASRPPTFVLFRVPIVMNSGPVTTSSRLIWHVIPSTWDPLCERDPTNPTQECHTHTS